MPLKEYSDSASKEPLLFDYDDGDDFMEPNDGYPLFFSQNQVDDFNEQLNLTRSQRVRAAMFPETLDEGIEIPSTQLDPKRPTTLQRLAEPSQLLKYAIINLINYQSDADFSVQAVPELIQLLNDPEPEVIARAAMMVHQLTKKEASRHAMMNSPEVANLVTAMFNLLSSVNDHQTMKAVLGTMHNLSHHQQGCAFIFKSFGIPFLVKLLGHPEEKIVFYAITTLHNLLTFLEGAKKEVRDAGGIQAMVQLLNNRNVKLLAIDIDCLRILTFQHEDSKLILLGSKSHIDLLHLMKTCNYEKLLWKTSALLQILSVVPSHKPAIVDADGMQILAEHLIHPSQRLVQNCLWILRNLSDAATKVDNVRNLLQSLIPFLQTSDANQVICAACILSNLTCDNYNNKVMVCQLGGVDALMTAVHNARDIEEVVEPVMCTLRHLTWKHSEVDFVQEAICANNGIQILSNLLNPPSRWPTIKAVIAVIRNMALNPENHIPFREHGAVHVLIDLLQQSYRDTFGQNNVSVSSMGSTAPGSYADGVRMEDIVEGTTAALNVLARDRHNRLIIRQKMDLQIFVQLLYKDIEGIQRAAAGVLCELAIDKEGAEMIVQQSATDILVELLRSTNEGVGTYSAVCLFRMCKDAPQEYQNRIMVDLMNFRLGQEYIMNADANMHADQGLYDYYAPSVEPSVHSVHSVHSVQSSVYGVRTPPLSPPYQQSEVGSVYSGMETMRVGDMRAMRAQPDYAIINDNSSPLPPPPSSNDGRQDMVDNGSMIGLPPPPTQWVVNDVSL